MLNSGKITAQLINEEIYARTFATFIESSTEYREMIELMKPFVEGFNGKPIHLMSIGAGNGCLEGDLIKKFGLKASFFYAVEPNKELRVRLQKEISEWSIDDHEIIPDYFTTDFKTEKRFDLIMMSHCLYYMKDPIGVVMTAKSLLKPNGKIVIFIQTEQGGNELYNHFLKHVEPSSGPISDHALSSAQIIGAFGKAGIEYGFQYGPSTLDVTDFIEKRATQKRYCVVTFFLQTKYEDLPEKLQTEIYEMVKERCFIDEDGKYMFKHPTAMIVIG